MSMMRRWKIKGMVCWLALALASGASVVKADDIFVWEFQHSLPGVQEAEASAVDSQGNLIITGYMDDAGDDDIYTIKVSSNGQTILWAARYENPLGDDWAVAVAVDAHDDVIVSGVVHKGVNNDIATIKYNGASGAQEWFYALNGAANGDDLPRALALDSDRNIYVAGYSQPGGSTADDAILFKLSPSGSNPDGTPIWQVHYNGEASGEDRFNSVSAGVDGIAVAGQSKVMHTGSRLDFDYLTIKYDYDGNELWQQTYDHGSGEDRASAVGMDSAGNVIVIGEVLAVGQHDMLTIKYRAADGGQAWATAYSAGSPNIPRGLVVDSDNEVYVTGNSFTNSGKDDFYTVRYAAANGAPVWEQVFDSGVDNSDVPQALALDKTGGLYVTGSTHKEATGDDDFQTLKYNKANGNQIWQQAEDGAPVGGNQQPVGVAVALAATADGNIYVAGWSQQSIDDTDYYAVKYSANLLNAPTGLNATVVSQTRVDLAWADNSSPPHNEDNFVVERCLGFDCADFEALQPLVVQNLTTFSDNTVSRDTWYSYRVKGKSATLAESLPTAPVQVLTTVINYPAPSWVYTHDTEGLDDEAYAIAMGRDNNPVATGMSATANSQFDYYTVKFDRANAVATPLWIDSYGSEDGQGDVGICLAVDSHDEVVVSGYSSLDSGLGTNTNDIFTIKYAATGPDTYTGYPLWTDQYSGPGNDEDYSQAVASAADGSDFTVVAGFGKNAPGALGNDDIYLIKYKPNYDEAGQQVWSIIPFDGGFDDYPVATAFTPDGDVVVVGMTYNANNDSDLFISQYAEADGSLMPGWPYTYDFGHGPDRVNALAVAADGSIYVAGYAMNAAGNLDIYINKFSANGGPQWGNGKIIDGGGQGYDEAVAIAIDPNDGDIVVGATITSASGSSDFHLLRYQADGAQRWARTLEQLNVDETLVGMAMSPSGEICLVGEAENGAYSDVLAVKYDHLGNLTGSTKFDNGFDDFATAITVNRLGEFYISGYSTTGELAIDDNDFVVFRFNGQELQAPSPFAATPHNTTVDLAWSENDANVSGYKLYRKNGACVAGGTTFSQSNLILTAAKGTTTYTNSSLNIGSTYCYGAQTYRSGTSEVSRIIERQVTTSTPIPPSSVVATLKNTSEVEVCWHDNSASEDGFAIQRCTGANCDFSSVTTFFAPPELDPTAAATCLVDTSACDVGAGKNFRYRVQSYKVNAWSSGFAGATDTIAVPALMAPSSLAATRVAEATVDLQWIDNTVDESEFVIERCQGAACSNFSTLNTISAVKGNVLLLEMDEEAWTGSNAEVIDYSGKGYAATAVGGPTTVADSHQGRAASMDGGNDYLTAPLAIDQSDESAGVTMMAWVKPTSTSGGQHYLFSTEDGTTSQVRNSWGLFRDGGTWQVATGEAVRSTAMAVSAGQWQHLAVVFAPGTGVRFYKNGVEVYISYVGPHPTSADFTVGRQGVLNQNFFDGLVDEAAVYDRALSAAEVQKLFSRGVFPESTGRKWFTDSTVTYNANYQYRIKARKQTDCGIDLSDPSNVIPVTTAPPPPQPLTATLIKPGVVGLAWTAQTTTQTGFKVERCNGAGCNDFVEVTSAIVSTASRYQDRTACFGSDGVNRYRIRALGPWGESDPSAIAEAVSVTGESPANLVANQVTEASVELSWTYAEANRDGFIVERCTGDQAFCDQNSANFAEVAASPSSGQDLALQALWRMEDASWAGIAGEVVDSSGKGHHGTAQNGAGLDTPGVASYGTAVFDGADDSISTGLVVDQSKTTSGATFMAWIYQGEQREAYQYLFSTDNGDSDWGLGFYRNYWTVDTGASISWVYDSGMTFNTWKHVAVVFDPDSGVQFYRDGVLLFNGPAIDFDTSTAPFTIGGKPLYAGYNFAGRMDEVMVLNRPLTAQEVTQYFQSSAPVVFTDSSGISTGVTYTYRISPFTNTTCGDWGGSAPYTEVTTATPTDPIAPDGLTVTQKSSTELDLSWHSNTSSESGFLVERCQGVGCDFSTHDSFQVGAGVTTYDDTSVCQGLTYRYRVKAVKGPAAPWEWETAYTAPVDQDTGAANPVEVALAVINEAEIDLSWSDSNQDEDGYEVSRCLVVPGTIDCDQPTQFLVIKDLPGSVNGALLHYRMDEASWAGNWNDLQDASGHNNYGVAYSGAGTVAEGRFGRAGSFNGSTSFVNTQLMINQGRKSPGVTMEAWVYPTMTDGNPRSVLSTENGGYDWGVIVQGGKWYVNTGQSQYDTGLAVDLNTWQHITAVFIPQVGIKFYKNNEVATINEIDYDLWENVFVIGRNASTSYLGYYFQGLVDEVLVYGRPLTAAEVAAHNVYQESPAYTYRDSGLEHSSTYHYKVTASKAAACGWRREATASATTLAPPPPTDFVVDSVSTTSATLEWNDSNGSETGYVLSRCEGLSGGCASPVLIDLPPGDGAMTYDDDTLCPGLTYSYRVWAVGAWGQTAYAEISATTGAQPDPPANFSVNRASEVEMSLSWEHQALDESGIKVESCLGTECTEVDLPPGTTSYADLELAPDTEYCYRVMVYKTADCGWQTAWTAPTCGTTDLSAGSLTATKIDTTTVSLAWGDTTQTETTSIVERCAGDLNACCNGASTSCAGPFAPVAVVSASQHDHLDDGLCAGSAYTYRVSTKGEGLSRGNEGCWTKRAPLTFTSFTALSGVEVVIPYQTEMRPDFADIRFYDATGHRELQYWLKEKTDASSATVWLMTGANANIYLYYGNDQAADGSVSKDVFTEVYDEFQGTAIDAQKWVVIDAPSDKIAQNNGLQFVSRDSNGEQYSLNAAVLSSKTFERAGGNELYFDFTVGVDAFYPYESFFLGWEQNQTGSTDWNGNAAHLLRLSSWSYNTFYMDSVHEDTATVNFPVIRYNDQTRYQAKIVLNNGQGAKYYLKGGSLSDWRLLQETTTARPDDDILRIGVHQAYHNITIHQVKVTHASAQRGATVNFVVAEGDGVTCLPFSHTWDGSPTSAAEVVMAQALPPTDLTASVVDGKVQLAWNAGPGDESEFRVERDCGQGFALVQSVPGEITTYNDASMPASTTCSYRVKGHKEAPCLWTSPPSEVVPVLAPPAGPALNATAQNAFQIHLDWSDAADEEGYDVEAMVFNGAWMPLASLPANQVQYTDSHGVNPSTKYTYRVRARRGTGNSLWSEDFATTPAYTPGAATCPAP